MNNQQQYPNTMDHPNMLDIILASIPFPADRMYEYLYKFFPYILILCCLPILYLLITNYLSSIIKQSGKHILYQYIIPLFTSPDYLHRARISGIFTIITFLSLLSILLTIRQLLFLSLFGIFLVSTIYFRLQYFLRYGLMGETKINELRQRILYNTNTQVSNALVTLPEEDHDELHHGHADPLYSMRFLDWLRDDTLSKKIAPYIPFILNMDNEEVQIYLQSAPPEIRNTLLRPGLIHLFPSGLIKLLLGKEGEMILNQQKLDYEILLTLNNTINNSTNTTFLPPQISVINDQYSTLPHQHQQSLTIDNTSTTIPEPVITTEDSNEHDDVSVVMGTPRTVIAPSPPPVIPHRNNIPLALASASLVPALHTQTPFIPTSYTPPEGWSHDLMRYVIQRRLALQIDHRLSSIGLSTGKLFDISVFSTGFALLLSTIFRTRFQKGLPLTLRKLAFGISILFWLLYFLRRRANKVLYCSLANGNPAIPTHTNPPVQNITTGGNRFTLPRPVQPSTISAVMTSPMVNTAVNLVSNRLGIPSPLPPLATLLSRPIPNNTNYQYQNTNRTTSVPNPMVTNPPNIAYVHNTASSPAQSTVTMNTVNSLIHYAQQRYPETPNDRISNLPLTPLGTPTNTILSPNLYTTNTGTSIDNHINIATPNHHNNTNTNTIKITDSVLKTPRVSSVAASGGGQDGIRNRKRNMENTLNRTLSTATGIPDSIIEETNDINTSHSD